jgi:hypothetical protein
MTALITILISLLGYGSPSDYQNYSEDQLKQEIATAEATSSVDGGGGSMEWP